MKIARTIGLAALAALALMASLGAGSAAAANTTLCKTAVGSPYCESGDRYAANTSFAAEEAGLVGISSNLITLNCEQSQLQGKTTASSGDPLPLEFSTFTLAQCGSNVAHNNCTASNLKVDKGGSLTRGSGSDGTLSFGASWHFKCTSLGFTKLDCSFDLDADGELEGGASAQLTLAQQPLTIVGGAMCPSVATFGLSKQPAIYDITSPKPAYVASVDAPSLPNTYTQLCKVSPTAGVCAEGNSYPVGTLLQAESDDLHFETFAYQFNCEESSVTFEVKQSSGWQTGMPLDAISSSFEGCTFGFTKEHPCTVTGDFGPSTLTWTEGKSGLLVNTELVEWHWQCPESQPVNLTFELLPKSQSAFNSTNHSLEKLIAGFGYEEMPVEWCLGISCGGGAWGTLSTRFDVTSPAPLYVAHKK